MADVKLQQASKKRVMIDKANQSVIVATSVAAFIVIFCLVAAHALFGQLVYQNRVASAKKQALSQLKTNIGAVSNLETAYQAFVAASPNVIGGTPGGTGDKDGDNAKIVLDALPSKYDFPALATSLEKIMTQQGVQIQSITGTDDEVAQADAAASGDPKPVEMPFQVSAKGSYQQIQSLTNSLDASIRPIQITNVTLTGSDNDLTLALTAQTYYQAEKTFTVGTKVIK